MATNDLSTVSGSGAQSTTQDPQAAPPFSGASTRGSDIQPGTTNATLDATTTGVALKGTTLSTITLGSSTVATSAPLPVKSGGLNPVLAGFSGLLFIIAIVLFVATMRPAKTTT